MNLSPTPVGYAMRYEPESLLQEVDVTSGIDVLVRPGYKSKMRDALDQRLVDALDSIETYRQVGWTGGKLTTLCFAEHGTPSTKFLVLAYNGLCSELDLRPGMVLKVPTKAALDAALVAAYAKTANGSGASVVI